MFVPVYYSDCSEFFASIHAPCFSTVLRKVQISCLMYKTGRFGTRKWLNHSQNIFLNEDKMHFKIGIPEVDPKRDENGTNKICPSYKILSFSYLGWEKKWLMGLFLIKWVSCLVLMNWITIFSSWMKVLDESLWDLKLDKTCHGLTVGFQKKSCHHYTSW